MRCPRLARPLAAALIAAFAGTAVLAPAPAPAGLLSSLEESLGSSQHEQMVQAFGGEYEDRAVREYVDSIGQFLARTSENPDYDYTFTVLDSPVVNAFALPGGYVYVTRGLMALAENEAQLAGVIAHEIGHVTARHGLKRVGGGIFGQLASVGLGILLGEDAAQLGNVATQLGLSAYSRDQEFEADTLGVKYLARAGYDPQAMASFLDRMQAHGALEAELAGREGQADGFNLLATHPRTVERIQEAIRQADVETVEDPMLAPEVYLDKIAGLRYGYSRDEGFVRGRQFLHPELRFAFTVPQGFRLLNGQQQVVATDGEGAQIVFDRARPDSRNLIDYIRQEWTGGEVQVDQVSDFAVDGLPAATGRALVDTQAGQRQLRLAAIRMPDDLVYRFLFVTDPQGRAYAEAFADTVYSFRRLSEAEAADLQPTRIRLHRVREGERVADLARQMPYERLPDRRFRVLNGLDPDEEVRPGQTVKLVVR